MPTYATPVFNLKTKFGNWLFHLGAWSVYMLYESIFVALAGTSFSRLGFYLLHYAVNILLFYFHAGLIFPLATVKKKNVISKLLLLSLLEIALFLVFKFATDHLIALLYPEIDKSTIVFDQKFIAGGTWRSVYFILLASGYYYLKHYIKERDNREYLEKKGFEQELKVRENLIELNKAKNAFLRAQINPHFLFNTLNFVYSSIHKKDPAAAKTLSLLSKLLRFALESGNGPGMIRIEEELKAAKMLLELWSIRQELDHNVIILDIDYNAKKLTFIPLILLTLMENMLKHGNLSEIHCPGRITIRVEDQHIILVTKNLINSGRYASGHQTGLDNIRQRLLLSYGQKAMMNHYVAENYFIVEIHTPI